MIRQYILLKSAPFQTVSCYLTVQVQAACHSPSGGSRSPAGLTATLDIRGFADVQRAESVSADCFQHLEGVSRVSSRQFDLRQDL